MPFGKYKGQNMEDIPARYLLWLYEDGLRSGYSSWFLLSSLPKGRLNWRPFLFIA
jgi:uncharacterized protein (DUF3820 family)